MVVVVRDAVLLAYAGDLSPDAILDDIGFLRGAIQQEPGRGVLFCGHVLYDDRDGNDASGDGTDDRGDHRLCDTDVGVGDGDDRPVCIVWGGRWTSCCGDNGFHTGVFHHHHVVSVDAVCFGSSGRVYRAAREAAEGDIQSGCAEGCAGALRTGDAFLHRHGGDQRARRHRGSATDHGVGWLGKDGTGGPDRWVFRVDDQTVVHGVVVLYRNLLHSALSCIGSSGAVVWDGSAGPFAGGIGGIDACVYACRSDVIV